MKVDKLKTLLVIPAKAGGQHLATCRLVRMATLVEISLAILFGLMAIIACTDYVQQIDDRYGEWSSFNPNIVYGEMTDFRDGQTYKTVKIGSQTWMAENLNYKTDNSFSLSGKYAMYGSFYTWAAAMDSAGTWSANGKGCGYDTTCSPTFPVRGICPEGWHLPSKTEWESLFETVGGRSTAGKFLRSQMGWGNGDDTDAYGFSALPAGLRDNEGNSFDLFDEAFFWSATEDNSNFAYYIYLNFREDAASFNYYNYYKSFGFSVRCIMDDETTTESSSSMLIESSSSIPIESSSSTQIESSSSESQFNPDIKYGELLDSRDGQTYKTVEIRGQVWMAQNLNYETDDTYCPDGKSENCSTHGRLYDWNTAKTVCPAGWHLPSKDEWNTLLTAVGGASTAGKVLKSASGWRKSGNCTDAFGFSAIPTGYRDGIKGEYGNDESAYFWSSTEYGSSGAYFLSLDDYYASVLGYYSADSARLDYYDGVKNWRSVRCLKDDETTTESSSSAPIESSSSESPFNPDIEYGELTDTRDGQTYKTVVIGNQVWMAENLNYEADGSFCYGNDETNCLKYGRLYTWAAATTECPKGWHLPSMEEWETLFTAVGGQATAAKVLKSMSGWYESGNGSDAFGFSALPAGSGSGSGFNGIDNYAYFWSATEKNDYYAYGLTLRYLYDYESARLFDDSKNNEFSVRCLQD